MSRQWVAGMVTGVCLLLLAVVSIAIIGPHVQRTVSSRPTATVTPHATVTGAPTATPRVPALVVRNGQVQTAGGSPVTLVGASHSALEYSCKGDGHFEPADFQAMRAWGMTVVRIPLWSRYWLNLGGSCPTYQATVATAVANAEAAHLYIILDLQWTYTFPAPAYKDANGNPNYQYPMPDSGDAVQFWQQVATRYRDDPQVLFDIYGEPNAVT